MRNCVNGHQNRSTANKLLWSEMSIFWRIMTIKQTILSGSLACITVIVLLSIPWVNPAQACTIDGGTSSSTMGYSINVGLFVTTGKTGKQVGAYQGIKTQSLETCIRACKNEAQCAGVTFRWKNPVRNCLKFSRTDYKTGEKRRSFKKYFKNAHQSVIVRSRNGSLCGN